MKKDTLAKLTYWNYRVFRYKKGGFGIHETWYDKTNKPITWTEDAIITGDTVKELLKVLTIMRKDIKHFTEIIEYDEDTTNPQS